MSINKDFDKETREYAIKQLLNVIDSGLPITIKVKTWITIPENQNNKPKLYILEIAPKPEISKPIKPGKVPRVTGTKLPDKAGMEIQPTLKLSDEVLYESETPILFGCRREQRVPHSPMNRDEVWQVRRFIASGRKNRWIADFLNIAESSISSLRHGKLFKDVPKEPRKYQKKPVSVHAGFGVEDNDHTKKGHPENKGQSENKGTVS